jgi:hypothetical protein
VAFDYAAKVGSRECWPPLLPSRPEDPLQAFITSVLRDGDGPYGDVLVAAWRAALNFVIRGGEVDAARRALASLRIEVDQDRGLSAERWA